MLLMLDLDGDRDVDLLWRGVLHPQGVVIWLNNGSEVFERPDPSASQSGGPAVIGSGSALCLLDIKATP